MENQELINILIGTVGAGMGYVVKVIWDAVKDLQEEDKLLVNRINTIEVLVAGNYMTREEFTKYMTRVFEKLDHIEDKLDNKVDK